MSRLPHSIVAPSTSDSTAMSNGSLMHSILWRSQMVSASVTSWSTLECASGQKAPASSIIGTVMPVTTAATGGRSTAWPRSAFKKRFLVVRGGVMVGPRIALAGFAVVLQGAPVVLDSQLGQAGRIAGLQQSEHLAMLVLGHGHAWGKNTVQVMAAQPIPAIEGAGGELNEQVHARQLGDASMEPAVQLGVGLRVLPRQRRVHVGHKLTERLEV